jgi:hypothetical protein
MPLKPQAVESVLKSKFGFAQAKSRSDDHRWYVLRLEGLPAIMTKLSHSSGDIGKRVEGMIARQLRVEKQFLQGMIHCSNDRESYYARVRHNPVPPWNAQF